MSQILSRNNLLLKSLPELDEAALAETLGLLLIYQEGSAKKVTVAALLQGLAKSTDILNTYVTLASTQLITGEKVFSSTPKFNNGFNVSTIAGTNTKFGLQTADSDRWVITSNGTPESGSNAGSDFELVRYADDGTLLDKPLVVTRSTGQVAIPDLEVGKLKNQNDSVFNVRDYGAIGDDSTDDYQAITDAITAATEGSTVYFPAGIYRVSDTIVLRKNVTIKGTHSPRWFYRGGSVCVIKPHSSFDSDEIVLVPDAQVTGATSDNDGGRIKNIAIDGNSKLKSDSSTVVGLKFEGLVRDWHVENVDVSQTSGNGIQATGYVRADSSTVYPRGLSFLNVSVYSAGNGGGSGIGFSLASATDSSFVECLAVDCESQGYLITNAGETKFLGCKAVFNNSAGFDITGSVTVGGLQLIGCSTDYNGKAGLRISATGDQPIQVVGLLARRDGYSTTGDTGGIEIIGTASNKVCPVQITGLSQTIGFDDSGGGDQCPVVGVKVSHATDIQISGQAWGVSESLRRNTGVARLDVSGLIGYKGTAQVTDLVPHTYSNTVSIQPDTDTEQGLVLKPNSSSGANLLEVYNSSDSERLRIDSSGIMVAKERATFVGDGIQVGGFSNTFGGGNGGIIGITNTSTVPASNPSGGVALYSEGGQLKLKGTTGDAVNLSTVPGLEQVYPVGSIYMNAFNPVNPATLLGFGTWSAIAQGRMLLGVDPNDSDFDNHGLVGGEKTHQLTVSEMPTHNHTINDPGHRHSEEGVNESINNGHYGTASNDDIDSPTQNTSLSTTGITINSRGGDDPHNNMPPYLTVYMWRRDS